ncbi:MAG: YfhO family protein [Vicinamibacteria bacterium]
MASTPHRWSREIRLPRPDRALLATAGALAAVLLGVFPGIWLRGETLFDRDVALVWLPQVEAFLRSVRAGSWPVWDPTVAFGHPLLANPNVQVFYPFTWLNLVIGPWTFYTLYVAAHLLIAGLGVDRLGRRMGLSAAAGRLAACAFVASGPFLSFVNVWHHLAGSAWLPWILLAADRAHERGRARDVITWGALVALQLLAGSPDLCTLTGIVLLADLLRRLDLRRPWSAGGRAAVLRFGLAYVAGLGLSAAQWVPSLALALAGARAAAGQVAGGVWSLHPVALAQLLLPLSFSDLPERAGPEAATRFFDLWTAFVRSAYLGLAAAVAVAWACAGPRRPWRRFLFVLGTGAVAVALGSNFVAYGALSAAVPPLRMMRYPAKAIVVAALAWSLLAGMGLDAWRADDARTRRRALRALGAGALVLAGLLLARALGTAPLAWALPGGRVTWGDVWAWNASAIGSALVLAAAATLASVLRASGGIRRVATVLLPLAVIADLVTAGRSVNVTARPERFDRTPPVVAYLERDPPSRLYVWDYSKRVPGRGRPTQGMLGYFLDVPGRPPELARIVGMLSYLYPPAGGRWGFRGSYDQDLLGLYPVWLEEMDLLLRAVEETPGYLRMLQIGGVQRVIALHPDHEGLVLLGSVPGILRVPIHVLAVPGTVPRVYVPERVTAAEGHGVYPALLSPDFRPGLDAVVSGSSTIASPARGTARIVDERPDRVRIDAQLETPALVVLTDGDAPGWRARVDGRPAEVRRVNGTFLGVEAPAGHHQIELAYRPASVSWGLGVSLAALATLAALLVRSRPRVVADAGVASPS